MNGPGSDAIDAVLYTATDFDWASATIRRLGLCHEHRVQLERAGNLRDAVEDAKTAQSLIAAATVEQLRAMVVQLTTPELRAMATVVARSGGTPVGPDTASVEGVGGLAAPTPPAPAVQLYRAVHPVRSELYCVDSGRAVKVEGDRCLVHGAAGVMCKTSRRAPRCRHQVVSVNHPRPVCSECGADLVLVDATQLEQQYRDSAGFGEES